MGKSDIWLTIAIPTYNRCDLLRQTIESVLNQRIDGIEVIVSDNASTDSTKAMMEKFCQESDIRYFCNSENLGMDRTFLNCLQKARGEYIHLLSDDDILLPGAVEKIMSLIEQEKPDYINLNSYTYSTDEYNPDDKKPPRIKLDRDIVTNNKNLYMKYLGVYITYISATVIKRNNIIKIKNPEKYFDTHFLHAHLVLDSLKDKESKVIITKEPYLAAKNNNSGGFDLYDVWIKQYKNLLLNTAVRNGFDYKLMKQIYINDVNGFIRDSILKYRVTHNTYGMKYTRLLFQCTYMYPQIWGRTYIYAILPRCIVKKIYLYNEKKKLIKKRELHKTGER